MKQHANLQQEQKTFHAEMRKNLLTRRNACDILSPGTRMSAREKENRIMNTAEVKQRMKDKHITGEMMARELGMDPSTYYRKMQKNGEDFSAVDLNVFKRMLELEGQEALNILLA